jgi:D-alanyl-D-alanine carboxypeptidase
VNRLTSTLGIAAAAILVALPATSGAIAPRATPVPDAPWAVFNDIVGSRLIRGNRAASVAVSIHGEPVDAAAFGTRAGDPADPTTTTDRFRLASISKVITSIVVLQLVDRGELTLDDPVGARLAGIAGVVPGDGLVPTITVRQLLSHTSGFPDYRRQFFGGQFHSCEEAAAFGLARPVAHQPGTTHDYSNLNFCLLSLLIAEVTGTTYEGAVNELLLTPLGISGMRLARTIDPNPDEVVHQSGANRTYMEALAGAGAWVASPTDVVRIFDSLDSTTAGWHPLPPELALPMMRPLEVRYPEPNVRRYGLGVVIWPDGTYGHTGTVENTHTMLVHRSDGLTWCILVSGDNPESTERLRGVFDESLAAAGIAVP